MKKKIPEEFKQFIGQDIFENIQAYEREPTEWLLYPFIPLGCLTLLQGDPGCGKSIFMMNVAAKLTRGRCMHGECDISKPENIIYQSREDNYSKVIRPRLEDLGANLDRVFDIKDLKLDLKVTDLRIPYTIWANDAKLVVLDTLPKYLNSAEDLYHQGQLDPQLEELNQVAKTYNCSIVLISHMNKNEGSKIVYRGQGSIAIAGTARSNIMLEKDVNGKRILSVVKSNLGPDNIFDTYQLDRSGRYHFVSRYEDPLYSDEIEEDIFLSSAGQELKNLLSSGPVPSAEILSRMKESGFSKRQIDNAKDEIGTKSYKRGNIWVMEL